MPVVAHHKKPNRKAVKKAQKKHLAFGVMKPNNWLKIDELMTVSVKKSPFTYGNLKNSI